MGIVNIFNYVLWKWKDEVIHLLCLIGQWKGNKDLGFKDNVFFLSYMYVVESILVYKSVGYRRSSMEWA